MRTAINKTIDKLDSVMDADLFRTATLSLGGFSAIMLAMAAILLPHGKDLPITKIEPLANPLSVKALDITDINSAPQTDISTEDAKAGFHESGANGFLPIKRADGQTIFDAYRVPFATTAPQDQQVSVIVYDVGLSDSATEAALNELPKYTTLVVSPYAAHLQKAISIARAKGMEVWLYIPLEPKDFASNDTGPRTLFANGSLDDNQKNLLGTLGLATGYTGVVTDKNNIVKQNETAFKQFNEILSARGITNHEITFDDSVQSNGSMISAPLTKGNLGKILGDLDGLTAAQKTLVPLSYSIKP